MKRAVISDPIYGANWLVQKGGTIQQLINLYSKRIGQDPWEVPQENRYGHFGARRPYKNGCIWLDGKASPAVVAHECTHAVSYLFEVLNCKLDENCEEFFTYYVEWLVREVLKRLYGRKY